MSEDDWLESADPDAISAFFRSSRTLSERKCRLFATACCRRVWDWLTGEGSQEVVEVVEKFADGLATDEDRSQARRKAQEASGSRMSGGPKTARWLRRAASAAYWAADRSATKAAASANQLVADAFVQWGTTYPRPLWDAHPQEERVTHAMLLRDFFGIPRRGRPPIDPAWGVWEDGIVIKLAETAYEERILHGGELDLTRLAVLADALEEVGADALLIDHLRGPGPHVRGCFVLDLLTGRA